MSFILKIILQATLLIFSLTSINIYSKSNLPPITDPTKLPWFEKALELLNNGIFDRRLPKGAVSGRDTNSNVARHNPYKNAPLTADPLATEFIDEHQIRKHRSLPSPIQIPHPANSFAAIHVETIINDKMDLSSHRKARTGVNLNDYLAQEIIDYTNNLSYWKKYKKHRTLQKELYVMFYHVDSEKMINAIIAAQNAGINVNVIVDLNTALEYMHYPKGKRISADFQGAQARKNASARMLNLLSKKGFNIVVQKSSELDSHLHNKNLSINHEINPKGGNIFSPPLYQAADSDHIPIPIMHIKGLYFLVKDKFNKVKDGVVIIGHHNPSLGGRINQMIKIHCPIVTDWMARHAKKTMEHFLLGRTIGQIRTPTAPLKFNFNDGKSNEYLNLAFTDGKYELNSSMMVERLLTAVFNQDKYRIEKIGIFDFAPTNVVLNHAILLAIKAGHGVEVVDFHDGKFNDHSRKSWDVFSNLAGYFVGRPHGKFRVATFNRAQRENVTSTVLEKRHLNTIEYDPNGYPNARHLLHVKSSYFIIAQKEIDPKTQKETWVRRVYVYNGSYNRSLGGDRNMEVVFETNEQEKSEYSRLIIDSLNGYIEKYKQDAKDTVIATFSKWLANFTHRSVLEVNDTKYPEEIIYDLSRGDLIEAVNTIEKLIFETTKVEKRLRLTKEQKHIRINRLKDFVKWYSIKFPSQDLQSFTPQKFTALMEAILPDVDWFLPFSWQKANSSLKYVESRTLMMNAHKKSRFRFAFRTQFMNEWINFEEFDALLEEAMEKFPLDERLLEIKNSLEKKYLKRKVEVESANLDIKAIDKKFTAEKSSVKKQIKVKSTELKTAEKIQQDSLSRINEISIQLEKQKTKASNSAMLVLIPTLKEPIYVANSNKNRKLVEELYKTHQSIDSVELANLQANLLTLEREFLLLEKAQLKAKNNRLNSREGNIAIIEEAFKPRDKNDDKKEEYTPPPSLDEYFQEKQGIIPRLSRVNKGICNSLLSL